MHSGAGKRRRILFLAEGATMAHFTRPLVLADSLDAEEYEVHFYTPRRYHAYLKDKPFASGELASMPGEKFLANIANGKPLFPADVLRRYVIQERELFRRIKPDLVIGDMRFSLPISARLEGVRHAVLMNAYWSPWARRYSIIPELPLTRIVPPRFLGGLYKLTEPLAHKVHVAGANRVREEHGLPRLSGNLREMYTTGDYVLYPDIPEFIPTPGAPSHHSYVGMCDWSAPVARPDWWQQVLEDPRPKAFIALGSSGPLRVLPRLLQALSNLHAAAVVATSDRDIVPTNAGVYVARLLPFRETAGMCNVVVSHGGSSGVYPSLASGTPVLGIPGNADQQVSTAFLQQNGAGLGVRVEEASEARLRQALRTLLFSSEYRNAANRWQQIFRNYDTGVLFRRFLAREFNRRDELSEST